MGNKIPTDYTNLGTVVAADSMFGYDSTADSNKNITVQAVSDFAGDAAFDNGGKTTTDLTEGTNLYYTDARVRTVNSTDGVPLSTTTDLSSNSWFLDEDTMSSDDATKVASQQSIKAYVDTQVATSVTEINHLIEAGENVADGDALVLGNPTQVAFTGTGLQYDVFYDNTTYEQGQSFAVGGANMILDEITIKLRTQGSPTQTFNLELYSDTGTTLVATSAETIDASTMDSGATDYTFNFGEALTASTTYYFKLNLVSGSVSATNYIQVERSNAGYGGGQAYNINSSNTWTGVGATDLYFIANGRTNDGKVYKGNASDSGFISFIGFANGATTSGSNATVILTGVSDAQSGLLAGTNYYLDDTDGAISAYPGTVTVPVGTAVSATELFVNKNT